MTPTTHTFRNARLAVLTLVTVAVVACAVAAGTARASSPPKTPTTPTTPVPRAPAAEQFSSLAAAVAAGRIDRSVSDTLRRHGAVDALVTFQYDQIVATAPGGAKSGNLRRVGKALAAAFETQERQAIAQAHGAARIIDPYPNLPSAFVRFTSAAGLLAVANAAGVTGIRENSSFGVSGSDVDPGLGLIRQPQALAGGATGAGTYVAVMDTGVDYGRAAFGSCSAPGGSCRVAAAYDFADRDPYRDDGSMHGTNVAGIIASIAPGTKIISMDVFGWVGDEQRASTSDVINALNYLVQLKQQGLDVVAANLSLSDDSYHDTTCTNSVYTAAFALARSWGILPVVSAGNGAEGDGTSRYREGIGDPACAPGAISVGAVAGAQLARVGDECDATKDADAPMWFSQSSPIMSLWAPGSCVTAAGITMQGTSQAAPHVTGTVALLAQARWGSTLYYGAQLPQIESALTSAGPLVTDRRSGVTKHRLDIVDALSLVREAGTVDTTLPTVAAPLEQIDGPLGDGSIVVHLSWNASDSSGIAETQLLVSTNGGSWITDGNVPGSAREWRYALAIGSTYYFAVRARDGAGNWNVSSIAGPFTVAVTDDSSFTLGGGWSRYTWNAAYGGTEMSTSTAGDTVSFSFTGRDVAAIGPLFAGAGRAQVVCDGSPIATVDAGQAAPTPRGVLAWCRFETAGQHTIKLVVEGTAGRPRIDVDAFAVLR